uniref:Histone deacetylase complex subunit SAP25 isoform X1 n=1 Tax=Castor canadensis TaxID=51338 RepID=A0A8B7W0B4_CASCN|nr:histone deacetylase complex subunit SAP25 isoform X1 [Castor canadensis]
MLEKLGLSVGGDQSKAWSSGGEPPEEPGTSPWDSLQPQAFSPSWAPSRTQTRRQQLLPCHPASLATEPALRTPGRHCAFTPKTLSWIRLILISSGVFLVPFSPKMVWEATSSRMALLSPWDPSYEAKARPQEASCGSGVSFSSRTLCHPSFWPMYEAVGRDLRPTQKHQNGQPVSRDAGLPVMCHEDFFFLDPLLPRGHRVPLYLSEPPQQAMGSLKLLLLPPIMSPSVCPSTSQGCSTAWLSEPELTALTGLLQMSQGEPRPSSLVAPLTSAGHTDSF